MATVTVSFTLDDQEDRDLVRWLDQLPKRGRSAAIRTALHKQLQTGISLGDVYQRLVELERKLERGAVLAGARAISTDKGAAAEEPPDVAAALDKLGL